MTDQEFAKIAKAIQTYYPRENIMPNQQAIELWFNELCDLEYTPVAAALRRWVATQKWSPSIAELRREVMNICKGEAPDWGKAWESVIDAVHVHGFYEYNAAMESLDETTRAVVDRIGWDNICLSDNHEATRANFRMIYENVVKRETEERQLSPLLVEHINDIQKKLGVSENEKKSITMQGMHAAENRLPR